MWHRRARKTTTAISEIIKQAHLRIGSYWHIFPTKNEAKDAIWRDPNMLPSILPMELVAKKNETELVIYFKNGSVYQLKGADDPDYLRGGGPVGLVLDEFAKMKYEAWGVLEPILRQNGGWCWFIGTPKGKNQLYQLYNRGQQNHHEWKSWLLKASTSGIVPADQLYESKATAISIGFYNQEWECEFLEGEGSVFRNVDSVMTSQEEAPKPLHTYVFGVDLAKVTDWTVIVGYDRASNRQVYYQRFQKYDWNYQKKIIKEISNNYNKAMMIIDSTGLGDPIADDLMRDQVPVFAYKISEPSKKELVEKLSIYIEQKLLAMIPNPETSLEFESFTYTLGPTGKIRYEAMQGFHDDVVIAHALACYSLYPIGKEITQIEKPIIAKYYEELKKNITTEDQQDGVIEEDWMQE